MSDYRKVWVTSDIHGYFNLYKELLEKIDLQDNDLLIIAGDSCDRGVYSAKMLSNGPLAAKSPAVL
ncbi:metallophosphoesterase [Sansalvadorimonas verongulae]|nr:metallophosphoesterase [Sansalvadorimonas verongulae]